ALPAGARVPHGERRDRHGRTQVDPQELHPGHERAPLVAGAAGHAAVDRLLRSLVAVARRGTGCRLVEGQVPRRGRRWWRWWWWWWWWRWRRVGAAAVVDLQLVDARRVRAG